MYVEMKFEPGCVGLLTSGRVLCVNKIDDTLMKLQVGCFVLMKGLSILLLDVCKSLCGWHELQCTCLGLTNGAAGLEEYSVQRTVKKNVKLEKLKRFLFKN